MIGTGCQMPYQMNSGMSSHGQMGVEVSGDANQATLADVARLELEAVSFRAFQYGVTTIGANGLESVPSRREAFVGAPEPVAYPALGGGCL